MTSTNPTHPNPDHAPIATLDDLWHSANQQLINRADALNGIHAILNITDTGAAEILDHPTPPSERYAQVLFKGGAR